MTSTIIEKSTGIALNTGTYSPLGGSVSMNNCVYNLSTDFTLLENNSPPNEGLINWWKWDGVEWQPTAEYVAWLSEHTNTLSVKIDEAVAKVYSKWLRFDAEYTAREAAARQYLVDATPSEWISGFATPAGLTEVQAATLIVQQADALRSALEQLGTQRMRKYAVKAATRLSEAQAVADDILNTIKIISEGLS